MIVDLIVEPLVTLLNWLASLLPEHEVTFPSIGGLQSRIAELDSVIPIAGPVQLVVVVMAAAIPFVLVRLVLLVRHVLLP